MDVSLCLIARDEEFNLPACLAAAAGLTAEVVVVDTGSTDRTREVAAGLGAKVVDFPWRDDFAAARNAGIDQASGSWIFWLDADDRLDGPNRDRLRELFAGLRDENVGYLMTCVSPSQAGAAAVEHLRIFRNRPDIRWRSRIHEQIQPAILASGGTIRPTGVVVHHTGYLDPALHRRKLERNLRLLLLEDAERPSDPSILRHLGQNYLALGRPAEAMGPLQRGLERSDPGDPAARKLFAQLARGYHMLGRRADAVAACRAGQARHPDYAELHFFEGLLLRELGDLAGAEACLLRLLRPGARFLGEDPGVRGPKARQNLGLIYHQQGRRAEAEAQWRAALAEAPDFAPARAALRDLAGVPGA